MKFYQSVKDNVPSWKIQGGWCDVGRHSLPSSCILLHAPSYTNLDGAYVYKIRSGYYGRTSLDGLNILELAYFKGSMWKGDIQASIAIFLDNQAHRQQYEAFCAILSGKAGGFRKRYAKLVREYPGSNFVSTRIDVADDFSYWAAELPGNIVAELEALVGPQTLAGYGLWTKREAESKSVLNTVTTMGSGTAGLFNTSERYRRIEKAILSRHINFKWSGP